MSVNRLHPRVMDKPRGAAKVRDSALSGGIGEASCPTIARSTSARLHDEPTTHGSTSTPQEPVNVFHQYRYSAVPAAQEEGHLSPLQPATHGDTLLARGRSLRSTGHPRSVRLAGGAHPLGLHTHSVGSSCPSATCDGSANSSVSVDAHQR